MYLQLYISKVERQNMSLHNPVRGWRPPPTNASSSKTKKLHGACSPKHLAPAESFICQAKISI